jgi:hypothetical protein
MPPEDFKELAHAFVSYSERNPGNAAGGFPEQLPGLFHAQSDHELVGTFAGGLLEEAGKVVGALPAAVARDSNAGARWQSFRGIEPMPCFCLQ